MNALNASLQGPETNIIHSSAKIDAFIRKLNLWHNAIAAGNPDFFDRLADSLLSSGLPIECVKEDICEHISALQSGFSRYFKLEKGEENFPWIADPFSCNPPSSLAPQLQEMLIDLSSDQTLKTEYQNVSLSHFWMKRQGDYPPLFKEAVRVLLPFASTYLCEETFSSLAAIKTKSRNRLTSVEDDLRLACTKLQPRIKHLMASMQAHVSH